MTGPRARGRDAAAATLPPVAAVPGEGAPPSPVAAVRVDLSALGALMPMFAWFDGQARLRAAGPTLCKLLALDPAQQAAAPAFAELFSVLRRGGSGAAGQGAAPLAPGRQRLRLNRPPGTVFRAQAVALAPGEGVLLNLGFGIHAEEAVRRHGLTDRDFAASDLTVDLLFLQEARSAVMAELARLNDRLDRARQVAEVQALTDPLTGLHNRRAMDAALADAAGSAVPFGLLHVDLDRVKQVNDTLGHAAGDAVLVAAARRLRAELRAGDIAARIGGDEFLLLLPGLTDLEGLGTVAARLIARLELPVVVDGQTCHISASIGLAASNHYPPGAVTQMLAAVDAALYAAKNAGRGRAVAAPPEEAAPATGPRDSPPGAGPP